MARYFITGGTGFIGQHLVKRLLSEGHRVACLSRRPIRHVPAGKNLIWIEADLLEPEKYSDCLRSCDHVVHLAGIINSRRKEVYQQVNVDGTDALLRICRKVNSSRMRFLYISSIAALGPSGDNSLLKETDTPRPDSEYGRSKLRAEEIVREYSRNIPAVILRPSFIYGPGDSRGLQFLELFSSQTDLISYSIIKTVCVCHVSDLVDACLLTVSRNCRAGDVFHISDPKAYTWEDLSDILITIFRELFPLSSRQDSAHPGLRPKVGLDEGEMAAGGACKYWGCDISKARAELLFAPRYTLTSGARETISWYRDNKQDINFQPFGEFSGKGVGDHGNAQ